MKSLLIKIALVFIISCNFISCQDDTPDPTIESTMDSLVGQWKYISDYKLVATVANPDVIIDSVWSGNYAPRSYFTINADSTYLWWRQEGNDPDAYGYGMKGKIGDLPSERAVRLLLEAETTDNFTTTTAPTGGNLMRFFIKRLSTDTMILFYRAGPTADQQYWYWHDLYVR